MLELKQICVWNGLERIKIDSRDSVIIIRQDMMEFLLKLVAEELEKRG